MCQTCRYDISTSEIHCCQHFNNKTSLEVGASVVPCRSLLGGVCVSSYLLVPSQLHAPPPYDSSSTTPILFHQRHTRPALAGTGVEKLQLQLSVALSPSSARRAVLLWQSARFRQSPRAHEEGHRPQTAAIRPVFAPELLNSSLQPHCSTAL
jgi:hypothetical protein